MVLARKACDLFFENCTVEKAKLKVSVIKTLLLNAENTRARDDG